MLKAALNAITRLHSRAATIKRLGTVDFFSPCRITPSNFFRYQRGPEYTTVKGVEFIIPVDSAFGHFAQKITFSEVPDAGTYKIKIGPDVTTDLDFDDDASEVQTELRLLTTYANVVVTGDYATGFTLTFAGIQNKPVLGEIIDSTLEKATVPVTNLFENTYTKWVSDIKKGDRILDGSKLWTVDEIMEMNDIGASVMAWRCRCD